MKNLIDRLIEFDNELIKSFKERYPRFTNLCLKMYNGKKFGYQFMDESGDVKEVEDTLENYRDGFLNRPLRTLPRYMVKSLYAIAIGDMKFGKKK